MADVVGSRRLRIGFARSSSAVATVQNRRPVAASTPTQAHVLLMLPPEVPSSIEWRVAARFLLHWQLAYLLSAGMTATLVCDGCSRDEWTALAADMAIPRAVTIRTTEDLVSSEPVWSEGQGAIVLLMAAPCLTDLQLGDALAAHTRSGRSYTVVHSRGRNSEPYLCILNASYAATVWHQFALTLQGEALRLVLRSPSMARMQLASGRVRMLGTGTSEDLRSLQSFWRRRLSRPGNHSTPWVLDQTAKISASARLRGPVIVGAGVEIGDSASIGPWVVLNEGVVVGERCCVEHAVVETHAQLEPEACVYRSIVDRHATVTQSIPVLKAQLHAGELMPIPQHSQGNVHRLTRVQRNAKRVLDLTIAGLALLLLLPVLLVLSCSCLLSQGWPILFQQERLGRFGVVFCIYKFRTMRRHAHLHHGALQALEQSARFKIPKDPRITGVGRLLRKTSLDELPQIINVLRGDMSIVGPRPIVAREAVRYGPYVEELLRTLPGITGLWQVSGRSNTTYQRRIMLDVKYGDTCSVWQDIKILLRTMPAVLLLRGAE